MESMHSTHRVNYQLRAHRRDSFIEFIKTMLLTPFVIYSKKAPELVQEQYVGVFKCIEELVEEHRRAGGENSAVAPISRLKELVPQVGFFFTPLPLVEAFRRYDASVAMTSRKFVPPSFNDIRHMLNISQLLVLQRNLRLITFDGDQTLYQDGGDFHPESGLVQHLVDLLEEGVYVALVTAAGYENNPEKYESRLSGLLEGFLKRQLPADATKRFYVMGGECNFLYRCKPDYHLEVVEDAHFVTDEMTAWKEEQITTLLDNAERSLSEAIQAMNLSYKVLRKSRGVGLIKMGSAKASREQLDELALRAKHEINELQLGIRFCAFNGGQDVWVDIGDKLVGVQALQNFLQCEPSRTLHVGDQFLSTGNDIATRRACCTVWVSNPEETEAVLRLLKDLRTAKAPNSV
mmetsp:Transcript_3945/g.11810  ORF Transcript_3945/g.11810 Transcript_3945/m.11810 type:complete len:405 (+) Transcript_3945:111-1325(+)